MCFMKIIFIETFITDPDLQLLAPMSLIHTCEILRLAHVLSPQKTVGTVLFKTKGGRLEPKLCVAFVQTTEKI